MNLDFFYEKKTPSNDWADTLLDLGEKKTNLKIITEGATCEFSFDNGATTSGEIKVADGTQVFRGVNIGKIALKGAGATVRVWAWSGE